jgi:large subunit ribosomal protein L6
MKLDLIEEIEIPSGVEAKLEESTLSVKGKNGEIVRDFVYPKINISIEGDKIILKSEKANKTIKRILKANFKHVKNMVKGVQEPFIYKLKICSGHFPMNVTIKENQITIKNFFGESVPRVTKFPKEVQAKVNGDIIELSCPDIEKVGLAASKIENLCRITNRDIRIFQDGCYLIHKAGKDL